MKEKKMKKIWKILIWMNGKKLIPIRKKEIKEINIRKCRNILKIKLKIKN